MNKNPYLHVLDGRIRLKSTLVKQSPKMAAAVEQVLESVEGISSVSANPITGSVLILFDTEVITQNEILAILEREGYWNKNHVHPMSVNPQPQPAAVQMNNTIANALAKSVVEVGLQLLVSAVL